MNFRDGRCEYMDLARIITMRRSEVSMRRSLLVGISGIDASGKGFITSGLASELTSMGLRVAVINVDGWLNLPRVRFGTDRPGEHFYHHALRLEELFSKLIRPLKQLRGVDLTMDFADETAAEFRQHRYYFREIDIILLEGIFIFKREFADLFDLKIWIDCSFETAMRRAIKRRQENLSIKSTIDAYDSIYFPAQRLHLQKDKPHRVADYILRNE